MPHALRNRHSRRRPLRPLGVVASAHPHATAAGISVLEAGGNAFDAAVAVAAALNVVEPAMSGIGGYGTIMTYHAADNRVRFLNTSGRIPAGVNSDAYRAPTPGYAENRRGAKAVSTPVNLRGWEALSKEYGSRDWATLFDPAIALARDGFLLSETDASVIEDSFEEFPPHARSIYGRDDAPLKKGERLTQADLARTLTTIAQSGAAAFYDGDLATRIDEAMRKSGGFLALSDLKNAQAEWYEPIRIRYRDVEVGHRGAAREHLRFPRPARDHEHARRPRPRPQLGSTTCTPSRRPASTGSGSGFATPAILRLPRHRSIGCSQSLTGASRLN